TFVASDDQSEAPTGAASPIGNNQQKNRSGKAGATVAKAATPQAIAQRPTLRARDSGVAFAVAGESGSVVVFNSPPNLPAGRSKSKMRGGKAPFLSTKLPLPLPIICSTRMRDN